MLITLCSTSLSVPACDGDATGPSEDPAYFPLTVGTTWTYAPEDPLYGESFEWRVTERQGDTATLARPWGGSHSGTVRLLDGVTEVDLLTEDDAFEPFYRFSAGASWVHRDPWECDDRAGFVVVEEPEPVVTPAGTFTDCLRIERRTTATCTDAGTMVEWWAPDVGLVRWEELNFYAGGPITFELVDFSVS